MASSSGARITRQQALLPVLCGLAFADTFGYALVVPLLPFAAQRFGASDLAIGGIFATYSLCQMLAAPPIGALSDRWGRRPVLLLSQAGSALGFVLMMRAGSVATLAVSRAVDGTTAGNVSLIYAAVLDRYPSGRWGVVFGFLSSASGIGILLGLAVSAALAGRGLATAATVALGICLSGMALTAVVFPETAVRRGHSWKAVVQQTRQGIGGGLRRIAALKLLATMAQTGYTLGFPLFVARRLDYDAAHAGRLMVAVVAAAALWQVAALPLVLSRWSAARAATAGFVLVACGGAASALVSQPWPAGCAAFVVLAGAALLGPALTALLAVTGDALDEGTVMGFNQSVASLGQMIGPLLYYAALAALGGAGYGLLTAALAATALAALYQTVRSM